MLRSAITPKIIAEANAKEREMLTNPFFLMIMLVGCVIVPILFIILKAIVVPSINILFIIFSFMVLPCGILFTVIGIKLLYGTTISAYLKGILIYIILKLKVQY